MNPAIRNIRSPKKPHAILPFVALSLVCAIASADDVKVQAFVTSSKDNTPRSVMPANTPRVYVIYRTSGVKAGDKFRAVLIADRAGHIAPENSKAAEGRATLDGDTDAGAISFSKPIDDWPIGDYHVEIYINDHQATAVKFSIEPPK